MASSAVAAARQRSLLQLEAEVRSFFQGLLEQSNSSGRKTVNT
jgi:hypothetical protein